jgi:hypothetical protein
VFKVGIIKITLKPFFVREIFFLSNWWFQIFCNFLVVYTFAWICTLFFHFFPTRIAKLKKMKNKKKNMFISGGEGLIQLFNARISPNYVAFTFTKEMKVKYILTFLK